MFFRVEGSLDWSGKGVRVSRRSQAYQQYKEDAIKDEDEAYKLGMNVSTLKKKRKRQQHGLPESTEKNNIVALPYSPNKKSEPEQKDSGQLQKAERELQKRFEPNDPMVLPPMTQPPPSQPVQPSSQLTPQSATNPYRSLVVPASSEVPSMPQVKKQN